MKKKINRSAEIEILKELKRSAGSHSPSPLEIESRLNRNPIKYDFCFLSNPYATDLVINEFHSRLSDRETIFKLLESYPAGTKYVASNISEFEGVPEQKIVVGNGAIQAIEWVCNGWGLKNLLIPTPTFSSYYEFLNGRHTFTDQFWLRGDLTADKLLALAKQHNADSILLILPNNPTGESISMSEYAQLVEGLGDLKLIVDESFCHFLDNYNEYRVVRESCRHRNIAFVKSMSKDFGIAGLRLGYLHTDDNNLLDYALQRTTWNLNNFSILFSELLNKPEFAKNYQYARSKYLHSRFDFYEKLCHLDGIGVFPSQANFFLLSIPAELAPDLVYELLVDYGVYVRTMEDKIGLDASYIRVAARREEENDIFLRAIKDILSP